MDEFGDDLDQSNIWQIPIPEEQVNKTFDKLFKFLLARNLVALGLYRLPGAKDNDMAYTCTNPDRTKTVVCLSDRVFVLGKDIPRDLLLDPKPF